MMPKDLSPKKILDTGISWLKTVVPALVTGLVGV